MHQAVTSPAIPLEGHVRTAFQRYRAGLVHSWSKTLTALAASMNAVFLFLDSFTRPPELLGRFAVYRAVVSGAMLFQYFLLGRTRPSRWSHAHGYAITVLFSLEITWMTVELGGYDSPYYAGLNLVIVGVNLMQPWRPLHTAVNGLIVLGVYAALNAVYGGPFHAVALVSNLFFLVSMVVVVVAISTVHHDLIAREFRLRAELLQANDDLDRSRRELKAARDALWGEMEVAKRIQTALLPPDRRAGGWDVAARMHPAAEVGGDYYDIIDLGEGRRWVAIGDASGHGVESGLVMMMTQTSLLTLVQDHPDATPAQVFHGVNRVLVENISRLGASRYMTLNVVRLGPEGLVLAGKHQDVLVWRRDRRAVEVVSNEGCWIGVVPDTRGLVADQLVPLAEGDLALFYTDGATEAADAARRMYGEERLAAALARVAERPLQEALDALFADIAAFRAEQDDDVTLMLVRRVGA